MAKGFRLRLGQSGGRLTKQGRGKSMARSYSSMAMDWIRDLCYDDYDESDWEWRLDSRFSKAKAADQLGDLFDPNYGPWEEVHEDSDSINLEDHEAMDVSCEGFSWNDHGVVDLSLGASKRVDCEAQGVSSLQVGPKDSCDTVVASGAAFDNCGSTIKLVKVEEVHKGMGSYGQAMWPHLPVNGHHKKKVIMGHNFLLVSRDCFRESKFGRRFQFFHKPSLPSVVVKVQEHTPRSPTDLNSFDTPVTG